jgi:hypothetical protein
MEWGVGSGKISCKSLFPIPYSPLPTPYLRFNLISNNFGQSLPVTKSRSEASS